MKNDTLKRKFHVERSYILDPRKYGDIFLLQVGRSHSTKDYSVSKHIHRNWFELTHVVEGKGYVITNGTVSPIKAGEIYLSFPGDIHAIKTDENYPMKFNFLSFWPDDNEILLMFEQIMLFCSDPSLRIFVDRDVEYLIGNTLSEALSEDEHSSCILSHALSQMIRYIIRSFSGAKKNRKLSIDSSRELCYQMMNYISTHIYSMNGLTDLAEHFGYSYSYLSDFFHKTAGDTLINYYTQRRLDAAAMLLREDHLSVSEIAELLKYSSIYSFSRAFKNRFGISPSKYKKQ